ncbi:3-dehydroquinate dehydratase [Mycena alexandri]|uniref:Catabolic 3-dehydroquinase n=1 Tax=Mycena alexandri TaxID=1745969 RepID=A0AAD6SIL8_9AGAR|nr:3-dehydroquinate dehydratase [Mycena alexandri]
MSTSTPALSILLLNGPNLNLLGTREPAVYGSATLADVVTACTALASGAGAQFEAFQSNHEGELVDRIQAAGREGVDAVVINPGAYTHTSVAIRDAFLGTGIPFIEVHISNIHAREAFRHHSYLSDKAGGGYCGLGSQGIRCVWLFGPL